MKWFLIITLLGAALAFVGCHNGQYPTKLVIDYTPAVKAADFRITNEFSRWKEDNGGYATYNDAISLQRLIDGGYQEYTDNGLVEGVYQSLSTTDKLNMKVYIMDFGISDQAAYLYNYKKSRGDSNPMAVGYPDSVAIGYGGSGGVTVYAHFGKFFFKVSNTGYTSYSTAISDANLFLGFYEKMALGN
ncbi:MAG: hypothetical protein PHC61_10550 [Chitinivibrionales bacterium]|nr:hypothetical protein [Chitinivibrionales bacterium]